MQGESGALYRSRILESTNAWAYNAGSIYTSGLSEHFFSNFDASRAVPTSIENRHIVSDCSQSWFTEGILSAKLG